MKGVVWGARGGHLWQWGVKKKVGDGGGKVGLGGKKCRGEQGRAVNGLWGREGKVWKRRHEVEEVSEEEREQQKVKKRRVEVWK